MWPSQDIPTKANGHTTAHMPYMIQRLPTWVDCCWHFLSVKYTVDLLVVHMKRQVVGSDEKS